MPSGQILYLMMFVGKCSCTSHVLQYSSSRSYEHSRSLQSILCPGVVTVLICSFFVAALLLIYINLKNGGKIIHIFTNHQTFSYLFCIFTQYFPSFYLPSHEFFVILHPKASRAVIFGWTRQPSFGSHGGQYDAEAIFINFKNIPSYATAHLLHQVCSALRRHADS